MIPGFPLKILNTKHSAAAPNKGTSDASLGHGGVCQVAQCGGGKHLHLGTNNVRVSNGQFRASKYIYGLGYYFDSELCWHNYVCNFRYYIKTWKISYIATFFLLIFQNQIPQLSSQELSVQFPLCLVNWFKKSHQNNVKTYVFHSIIFFSNLFKEFMKYVSWSDT